MHACRYDKDGSGELETMEFVEAVRQTGASEEICTNKELYKLFREVSARSISCCLDTVCHRRIV